jgi:hypothetical protein
MENFALHIRINKCNINCPYVDLVFAIDLMLAERPIIATADTP